MDNYNNSFHSSIKRPPNEVTPENEKEVWRILYGDTLTILPKKYKFKEGDYVRISLEKTTFRKGYKKGWTDEIFVITNKHPRIPPVYNIKDLNDEIIEGTFYEAELQKVKKPDKFDRRKTQNQKKRNKEDIHI